MPTETHHTKPELVPAPTLANLLALRTRTDWASALRAGDVVLIPAVEGYIFGTVRRVEQTDSGRLHVVYGFGEGDNARTERFYRSCDEVQIVRAR